MLLQFFGVPAKIVFLLLTRANRSRFVLMQGAGRCDSLQHPSARITLPSVPVLQHRHVCGLRHPFQFYKQQLFYVLTFPCFLKLGIAISQQHGLCIYVSKVHEPG